MQFHRTLLRLLPFLSQLCWQQLGSSSATFVCQAGPGHPERNHQLMLTQPQHHPPQGEEASPAVQDLCSPCSGVGKEIQPGEAQSDSAAGTDGQHKGSQPPQPSAQAQGGHRAAGFESHTGTEEVGSAAFSSLGGTGSPWGVPSRRKPMETQEPLPWFVSALPSRSCCSL